ncbi:MAG: 50S ribosomal protein L11 methyltransferase [Pseudomonadales bacterium]|nr:50S ribosomal protein L11 methyltransferase [Pseudomonadales bacterium]
MSWLQLHIDTSEASASDIESALLQLGAVSVTLQDNADQPLLEPGVGEMPLWDAIQLTALFDGNSDSKKIIDRLLKTLGGTPPNYRFEKLDDQDWERSWLNDFEPLRFGEKLWICPSWYEPPEPDAINIALDPGLAFGTGTHQTTALCLEWLEQASLKNKTIIDYGCGSGILAIAALLLGAKQAICVDNDPQALAATLSNAAQNNISDAALTVCKPEKLAAILVEQDIAANGFDFVIANILAGPLISLVNNLTGLMNDDGAIILSGILDHQAASVAEAYAAHIDFDPFANRDEWMRLSGKKLSLTS